MNIKIMIQPADRLSLVQEYYFSKKLKEVAQMNAEGKDVISLAIGSPDMPPSTETINKLCEVAKRPDAHGYQLTMGIPELREAMAGFYKRWYGVELDGKSEVLPLIGSKEGILHITLAFVNPGEEVLVPNPGYPTYTSLSKILGAKIVNYNLREDNGWQPDFDELEKMDLARIGRELIASGKGTVTPYGIIFDNDVDILTLYNCEAFPDYHYKASKIDVAVVSPYTYTATMALYLPASQKQIERTLQRFLQFERDDFQLCIENVEPPVPEAWREKLFEQSEIYNYNDAAAAMARLEESQYEKFAAVLRYTGAKTPEQLRQVAKNLEMFEYVPSAKNAEDVGRSLILESGHFEVDPNLEDYIDFEAYGRDHLRYGEGEFSPYGYVGYTGDERLFFHAEEQQAMGQQMGGMT